MNKLAIIFPLAAILCGIALESAQAQSCGERATQLQRQYAAGSPSSGAGTAGEGSSMPTPPATLESRGLAASEATPRQAAEQQDIDRTLAAAQDADRRGNSAGCEQLLSSARRMAGEQ